MQADEYLRQGDLEAALAEIQAHVRKHPDNAKYRIFLFQLLSVLGQWDRALTQLNVAGELDAGALAMVQTYREALQCEGLRREIFAGQRSPMIFGDPEHWLALLVQALGMTAAGRHDQADALRGEAFDQAPATAGDIEGTAFEWIADADSRLGPVLEAIVNGRYYWIPLHRISRIQVEQPADLRDLVWAPAYFTWANGGESVGLIPARYPGSERAEDSGIRLARKTEWIEVAPDVHQGIGQRMLATDAGEFALLDVRAITLQTAPVSG